MIDSPIKRLATVALFATVVLGACSSSGGSAAPSATGSAAASGAAAATAASGSAAASMAAPPPVPSGNISLQGAGATFPAPLYDVWFQTFTDANSNIKIDYQANGSGAGITAITQQTVDFGASDAPMKDAELAAIKSGLKVLHIPTALGAVVVIFNLQGVDKLQLDSANVAGIFLGTITKWNDPAIAANNPGVTLPDTAIAVVHRSDGSGTTNAFTTYLDTVSPDWHSKVGAGKEVKWPVGIGAQGNDGVATGVKQTPGSVGYVELQYATTAKLTSAYLKNADGKFVPGSTAGVTAAAEAAKDTFPQDMRQAPIINGAGLDTYPIASYTYLLVYQDQTNADKGKALVSFMGWALTQGQGAENALGYAPLPAEVAQKAIALLHTITTGGSPIWP